MRKLFLACGIVTASISATALAATTLPWKADVAVSMAAQKDTGKKQILYTVAAKNNGDGEARDVILSVHTPAGLELATMDKGTFDSCSRASAPEGLVAIRCKRDSLAVNAAATMTIRVTVGADGPAEASAQVFNTVPDYVPTNNFATVTTQ